jgi:hypothetical protein
MIIRPSTWKSFIENHPSAEAANKAFPMILAAFSQEKSIDDCINAALGLSPCVFLVLPMDAPHPILIHHFDSDDYLGLISWDDTVSPVRLDPSNLFKLAGDGTMDANGVTRNSFSEVDKNYLMQASNTIRFEEAQVINQGQRIFLRRCIPVPPFVTMAIINSGPLDAHDLGTAIATLFRSIEQDAHHDLYEVVTSAPGREAARNILSWLFMAKLHQDMKMSCSTVFPGSKLDILAKSI